MDYAFKYHWLGEKTGWMHTIILYAAGSTPIWHNNVYTGPEIITLPAGCFNINKLESSFEKYPVGAPSFAAFDIELFIDEIIILKASDGTDVTNMFLNMIYAPTLWTDTLSPLDINALGEISLTGTASIPVNIFMPLNYLDNSSGTPVLKNDFAAGTVCKYYIDSNRGNYPATVALKDYIPLASTCVFTGMYIDSYVPQKDIKTNKISITLLDYRKFGFDYISFLPLCEALSYVFNLDTTLLNRFCYFEYLINYNNVEFYNAIQGTYRSETSTYEGNTSDNYLKVLNQIFVYRMAHGGGTFDDCINWMTDNFHLFRFVPKIMIQEYITNSFVLLTQLFLRDSALTPTTSFPAISRYKQDYTGNGAYNSGSATLLADGDIYNLGYYSTGFAVNNVGNVITSSNYTSVNATVSFGGSTLTISAGIITISGHQYPIITGGNYTFINGVAVINASNYTSVSGTMTNNGNSYTITAGTVTLSGYSTPLTILPVAGSNIIIPNIVGGLLSEYDNNSLMKLYPISVWDYLKELQENSISKIIPSGPFNFVSKPIFGTTVTNALLIDKTKTIDVKVIPAKPLKTVTSSLHESVSDSKGVFSDLTNFSITKPSIRNENEFTVPFLYNNLPAAVEYDVSNFGNSAPNEAYLNYPHYMGNPFLDYILFEIRSEFYPKILNEFYFDKPTGISNTQASNQAFRIHEFIEFNVAEGITTGIGGTPTLYDVSSSDLPNSCFSAWKLNQMMTNFADNIHLPTEAILGLQNGHNYDGSPNSGGAPNIIMNVYMQTLGKYTIYTLQLEMDIQDMVSFDSTDPNFHNIVDLFFMDFGAPIYYDASGDINPQLVLFNNYWYLNKYDYNINTETVKLEYIVRTV